MIVPDGKNWTWVLERRCPDCGFDAGAFDPSATGRSVRDLGSRWVAVLARPDAQARPRPDVWSPLEYGCHVRDVLRLFDARLAMMLSRVEPRFENWDQDATAVADDYGIQAPAIVADELVAAAAALAARFDGVRADEWSRTGIRSDGSAFTVSTIAQYLMHDPVHHLWDVGAEIPVY